MKTAVFIGHNNCFGLTNEQLENAIIDCIGKGVTEFLSGGQGGFDKMCALTVFSLKKRYPEIKNILVIPYLTFNVFKKEIYDEIRFPEGFEKYYYKFAIPERNKYMVKESDVAICYVYNICGNAMRTYEFAQKKGIEIINLALLN